MDTLDPRHLITLAAVVRHGSFASAADDLACTQSAVSQQIAEIERRVGIRVLDRRPVRPTEAGQVLLEAELAVRTSIAIALQELSALSQGRTGRMRLGAFASAAVGVVPRALAELRRTHPDVQVKLSQLETETSYAQILRGDLDLAITFDYDRAERHPPARIHRTLVAKDPVLVVLPVRHRLAGCARIGLAELAEDAWIASPVIVRQLELLAELSGTPGFNRRLEFDGEDFQTVLTLVDQGLGVALLPKLATLRAPSGVVMKSIVENPLTRFIYTSRIEARNAPAIVSSFEGILTTLLRAALVTDDRLA